MKKIIMMFFFMLLIACSKEDKIKSSLKETFVTQLDDPSSYEVIEVKILDTLTYKKAINERLTNYNFYVANIKDYVAKKKKEMSNRALSSFLSGNYYSMNNTVSELDKEKAILNAYENDTLNLYTNKISKLNKIKQTNDIIYFRYTHSYRTKNKLGALVKFFDTIRVDKDSKVIDKHQEYISKTLKD